MPSEKKEKVVLKSKDYTINGNDIRAFYDKQGKLVFVLDFAINNMKPNVLLVMAPHGDRKWDDVLANDYGMDLELIRPKKDNKYQKLDIEYDGLVVYDNLIRTYKDGGNIKSALKDLDNFRAMSVRRSAKERLATSTVIAENARETIERTGDTIVELQAKIKAVRSKLTSLRRAVGKEPTKQSAAKILKAEAQLDVLSGKLERAKKRLENANKRLLMAEEDMDAARKVLDLVPEVDGGGNVASVPVVAVSDSDDEIIESDDGVDDEVVYDDSEDDLTKKDDTVLDEEEYTDEEDINTNDKVKPLFDKDPHILDDKIAFKPISFDEQLAETAEKEIELPAEPEEKPDVVTSPDSESAPVLSFAPPKNIMDVVQVPQDDKDDDVKFDDVFSEVGDNETVDYKPEVKSSNEPAPVLDSLQNINADTEVVLEKDIKETEIVAPENTNGLLDKTVDIQGGQSGVSGGVSETGNETVVRPVSMVRPPHIMADNVSKPEVRQHRPSLLYYVLLLVLIALSVFTLWLYQRSNVSVDAVPELAVGDAPVATQESVQATVSNEVEPVEVSKSDDDTNPFVASAGDENKVAESGDAPVVGKMVEDSLTKIAKAAELQAVNEVPDVKENLVESNEVVSESVASTVNKPEYKVTQENVFTTEESDETIKEPLCDDGLAPDANGCCAGETYSVVDGQYVCCPDVGGDCFPPLEW